MWGAGTHFGVTGPCRGVPEPPWSLGESASQGAALCQTLRFTVQLSDLRVSTRVLEVHRGGPGLNGLLALPGGDTATHQNCLYQRPLTVPTAVVGRLRFLAANPRCSTRRRKGHSLPPPALETGFCLLLHRQINVVMEEHFIKHIQLTSNK